MQNKNEQKAKTAKQKTFPNSVVWSSVVSHASVPSLLSLMLFFLKIELVHYKQSNKNPLLLLLEKVVIDGSNGSLSCGY